MKSRLTRELSPLWFWGEEEGKERQVACAHSPDIFISRWLAEGRGGNREPPFMFFLLRFKFVRQAVGKNQRDTQNAFPRWLSCRISQTLLFLPPPESLSPTIRFLLLRFSVWDDICDRWIQLPCREKKGREKNRGITFLRA